MQAYASVDKAPPVGKLVAKEGISKECLGQLVKSQEVLFSKEL